MKRYLIPFLVFIKTCFILVKAVVSANLAIFVIFDFGDFLAIDRHARVLNTRHFARDVARFKQIVCCDCELYLGAVTCPAMTSVTHDHVELH